VKGAVRRYGGLPVLRGVDLDVERGESVALFGPNGAGKTTLLRTLAGLLRADSGSVSVLGRALPADAALRRRIGYLGHESFLYRDLDARENLAYYARLFGVPASRIDVLLGEVGLAAVSARRVSAYSRGMLQRLALARAVLHEPELLLLDEPLTGLDPEGVELFARLLGVLRGRGVTVLMATHDIERALAVATRAVVLGRGRIVWDSGAGPLPDAARMAIQYSDAVAAA
jgi:heme exporter protein A